MISCSHRDRLWFDAWFSGKAGRLSLDDYRRLAESARAAAWPVRLRFGLEMCHFSDDAARALVNAVRRIQPASDAHRPEDVGAGLEQF